MRKKYVNEYKQYTTEKNGRLKDEAKYIGDYYSLGEDEAGFKKIRMYHAVTTVLAFALWVAAGVLNNDLSRQMYVVLPFAAALLPIMLSIGNAFKLMTSNNRMTHITYDKTVLNLKYCTAASLILFAGTLLGSSIFAVGAGEIKTNDLIFMCIVILSGLTQAHSLRFQSKTKTRTGK